MLLYFKEKIRQLDLSVLEAFETAYVYTFDKQGHVVPDYCEYITHGVLPKYVINWVKNLQGES
jgi:hypothetical protein